MFLNLKKANARIAELEAELEASQGILAAAEENGAQLDQLQARNTELEEENAALITERDNLQASVDSAASNLTEATERAEAAEARVTELEAEATTAETQAADIVAASGIPADQQIPDTDANASDPASVLKQYQAISNPAERAKFRMENLKALETAASQK